MEDIIVKYGGRIKDNGYDHGMAAPMFIIGGATKGKVLGQNPNLSNLDNGDLKHEIYFRSIYASLLKEKMEFDAGKIGIRNESLIGAF